MAKKSKRIVTKKDSKAAGRTVAKRAVAKKKITGGKSAIAKKRPATKKKTANSSLTSSRKTSRTTTLKKTIRRKAAVTTIAKQKRTTNTRGKIETKLPLIEKTNETTGNTVDDMQGIDKKSLQRAAARNYDNHHIRLSDRKGGIKPSGKKPLW